MARGSVFSTLRRVRLEHAKLPTDLVESHEQGRLVLFVGAGVSLPAPSCIPLLDGLAYRVADQLGLSGTVDGSSAPEEMFEELDGQGLGVHAVVHRIVGESQAPNDVHRAVAEIARAGPAIRIVTTNYDRHLAACLPESVRVFEAPDLPGDEDFEGVVHLHGWVEQEPNRLIVTKSDFAEAYMQPLSPTLAFLHRLFASKTVLFVGYSADDTLMQYVLRAARGRTDLFTIQERPVASKWEELDIDAVAYESHDLLPTVLGKWARRVSAIPTQHDEWVSRVVASCASLDELSARDESYLSDVVANPDLVRVFTRHARGPIWFRWVAERVDTALFEPAKASFGAVDEALLEWFLGHFDADDETANEVVRLIVSHRRRIHPKLAMSLEMRLSFQGVISSAAAARLRLVLRRRCSEVSRRTGHPVRRASTAMG